ncbi:MAG: arginyltransferase [Halobacteriovoraceae bacterium]|nr:arginyltransferase [Halobacteriovoraceae bacterium]
MKLLSPPRISPEEKCPYLPDQQARHEFFLATEVDAKEFNGCLEQGFRKFGIYFFRPNCSTCKKCLPLRVRASDFKPTKSQKRVLNKNKDVKVFYKPLLYREEIFQLFVKHSKARFNQSEEHNESREEFIQTHFTPSTPSLLSEFFLEGKLIAVGFLDISSDAVSSVYFIYDPDFQKRSLGILGALKEIEYTKKSHKSYYYLGYYIEENRLMSYKNQFHPYEVYDWGTETWKEEIK